MRKRVNWFEVIFCLLPVFASAQGSDFNEIDVLSYQVNLKPDIRNQTIAGDVIVKLATSHKSQEVVFDCGNLVVENVLGKSVTGFQKIGQKLIVGIQKPINNIHQIHIFYHGSPKRGVVFSPASSQVHTYYFTSDWMVCNDQPNDRASIKMRLTVADGLNAIGTGELTKVEELNDQLIYSWDHPEPAPPYTYGFVIGKFNTSQYHGHEITYDFYSNEYNDEQLALIFKTTADMGAFFENKSGVPYFQGTYSQVLIGNMYQEMSGFSILKDSYGSLVLNDSTETNLIGHEFAHQWWGNMITCKNWSHFWLNEAFATFMSAAYNEHRFGKEKYRKNIQEYFEVYEAILNKGKDKSLIFDDWSNPSRDDRNLVYFKGAYVLHLLRIEMGEINFWEGIQYYSKQYFGKSVDTEDFKKSMEESAEMDLSEFFDKWVYNKK